MVMFYNTNHTDLLDENRKYSEFFDTADLEIMQEYILSIDSKAIITSAIRCPKLNTRVKGYRFSKHLIAKALDFVPSRNTLDIFNIIRTNPKYRAILEKSKEKTWIHLEVI